MYLLHSQTLQRPRVLVFMLSIGVLLLDSSCRSYRVVALEPVKLIEPSSVLSAQNLPVLEAAPDGTSPALPRLPPVMTPAPPALPSGINEAQPPSGAIGRNPVTKATSLGFRYRVVVEAADEAQKSRIRSLVPDAFHSAYQGKAVMQVGAFREQAEVDQMIQRLSTDGFRPIVEQLSIPVSTPSQTQVSSPSDNPVSANAALIAVPRGSIPVGNAGNLPPVIVSRNPVLPLPGSLAEGAPPPPPPSRVALLGFRYRVVVEAADEAQKSRIRSLVPDAFRSAYQGKAVMQVGAFREQAEVDQMIQRLNTNGFEPIVEQL